MGACNSELATSEACEEVFDAAAEFPEQAGPPGRSVAWAKVPSSGEVPQRGPHGALVLPQGKASFAAHTTIPPFHYSLRMAGFDSGGRSGSAGSQLSRARLPCPES